MEDKSIQDMGVDRGCRCGIVEGAADCGWLTQRTQQQDDQLAAHQPWEQDRSDLEDPTCV